MCYCSELCGNMLCKYNIKLVDWDKTPATSARNKRGLVGTCQGYRPPKEGSKDENKG